MSKFSRLKENVSKSTKKISSSAGVKYQQSLENQEETFDPMIMDKVFHIIDSYREINNRKLQEYILDQLNKYTLSEDLGNKEYLSFNEACNYLGITRRTLNNWINKGKIKGVKEENGRWKFKRVDIEKFSR